MLKEGWNKLIYTEKFINETHTMPSYKQITYMYGIAITYGVVSLLLLGSFAYITFKITSKK